MPRDKMKKGYQNKYKIIHTVLPTQAGEKTIKIYVRRKKENNVMPFIHLHFTHKDQTKNGKKHKLLLTPHEEDTTLLEGTFIISDDLTNIFGKEREIELNSLLLGTATQTWERKDIDLTVSIDLNNNNAKKYNFIVPRPLRIALMGDSYAAGVGTGVYDLGDPDAFRSSLSGLERYKEKLREDYRVQSINTTFSGAQLLEGNENKDKFVKSSIIAVPDYAQLEESLDNNTEPSLETYDVLDGTQLEQVINWLDQKSLDYIFITIGGNDMYESENGKSGLSKLIRSVLFHNVGDLNSDDYEKIERGKRTLKIALDLLVQYSKNHSLLKDTKWILNTYPDMTKNEQGNYSDYSTISELELQRVYELVLEPLNQIIITFCENSINSQFIANDVMEYNPSIKYHGVTSTDPWFNGLSEVLTTNDDHINRSFHPNIIGQYEIYYKSLKKVFAKGTVKNSVSIR